MRFQRKTKNRKVEAKRSLFSFQTSVMASEGDSTQNEATTRSAIERAPTGNRMERFVDSGEELLRNLTKTVQDLTGRGNSLKTLSKTVQDLQQEVQSLKRQNSDHSDSTVPNKKVRAADEPGPSGLQESPSTGKNRDEMDEFLEGDGSEVEISDEEQDTDLLDDIEQYFETKAETGDNLSEKMARVLNRVLREDPDDEKLKELKERYRRPGNVDMLQVPTIDSSLWNVLDRQSRAVDLILQRYMSNIATCMVPVLQIVDVLQSQTSADDRTALKQRLNQVKALSGDAFKLLSHTIRANIHERKSRIEKLTYLKPRLKSILKDNKSSATQLFGDNLKDEMKSVNEKAVALTVDQVDRPKHSRPHFLSRRGGNYQMPQRRNQGPPFRYNSRDQGRPNYRNKP